MKDTVRQSPRTRVLLELRPAFDGFAGIPQETRLLFRGLRMLESCEVAGLLQMSGRILAKGVREQGLLPESLWLSESQKINRYSRIAISAAERPYVTFFEALMEALERRLNSAALTLQTLLCLNSVKLSSFRTTHFEDFIWGPCLPSRFRLRTSSW